MDKSDFFTINAPNILLPLFMEYLVSGIPVIASELPNIQKILTQHNVGEIAPGGSNKTINNIVIDIYKNKASYQKNINVAANLFNWNVQHNHFMEVLNV